MNDSAFDRENGILIPRRRPSHREDEYDEHGFDVLLRMQREHFWYVGRHKLVLAALRRELRGRPGREHRGRAIDMGGGCGGWLEYLHHHDAGLFEELALGDSSMRALSLAEPVVGSFATRCQIDLLDLPWRAEWDVVFLLDVLEHIPDHLSVLQQIRESLRPGGLLVVTTPALQVFWTYNDELASHQRRYSRDDFRVLAREADLELLRAEYFMFLLSPALLVSRTVFRPARLVTLDQRREHLARTHRIPARPINELLSAVFSIEASLVNSIRFPWGTSILGVFRR